MSRNTYQVTEQAVSLWRSLHGNETLDQQCQRFDGYYWQWAWAGTEAGIRSYPTATAAANASVMYSTRVNEPGVSPGDLANWWWNPEGHVGTVIGVDNGRVLVSHTSSKGDTVVKFSNNVKISHADTIGLSFRGYSKTNGANLQRTGLSAWPSNNQPSKGTRVKVYKKQDRNARGKGRVISPGRSLYLHESIDNPAHASNVVGGQGNYSITPHIYAEGKPGDVLELKLRWQYRPGDSAARTSDHYVQRLQFDRDGLIRDSSEFKGYVGDPKDPVAVYVHVSAPSSNKGDVKITLLDCDSYLFV